MTKNISFILKTANIQRAFNIMKLIAIFLAIGMSISYAGNSYSQITTISLNLKNKAVSEVLKEIEKNSEYIFLYNQKTLDTKRVVSIESNNETISNILDKLFEGTDNTYRVSDRQVYISKSEEKHWTKVVESKQIPNRIILTGTVVDNDGLSLPGVNIYLKSENAIGTITDVDGKFSIAVPNKNDVLVFTFIGMKNQEVKVAPGMSPTLNIAMRPQDTELGEVVVTGIFNKAKESFTGAATSISSEELREVGNRSLLSSIQNIDPAFNIMQDITIGSDPNALPSITIRGSSSLTTNVRDLQEDNKNMRAANQPLFIMNGFEISISRFMDLDQNQVENITLLKDNSATSLYGSRGANGVVVITTKRPEPGKLRLSYTGGISIEAPALSSYNLLNSREKLQYEKAAGLYENINANQSQEMNDLYNRRKIDAERGVDTYWIKYPVRVGVGHKHSLRLEGGDDAIRYTAGISYNNITGAMKGSDRNTFNGNLLLQYRLKNFIFQNDLQISQNKAYNSPYGTFQDYAEVNSYWTPYDDNGNMQKILEDYYYLSISKSNKIANPLWDAVLPQRNDAKYQQITNNFSLEWNLTEDLFVRGRLSATSKTNRSDRYVSAKATIFDGYTGDNLNRRGRYTYGTGEDFSYDGDITLNYSKLFNDKHLVVAGLGYNIGEEKGESYSIVAEGISNINMDFLGMASQYYKDGAPSGSESIMRRVGGKFTGNYIYDNRYFVDLSASIEGSSKFGVDKRFAPFWSTGIGWNMHHEDFLRDNSILNVARLRLSYGTSGSQNFNSYQALTTFRDYGGGNYRTWNGVYLLGLGNKDLGWQSTYQVNLGTDIEMFNQYLKLNFDVYNKITNNLVSDVNLPSSSGFDSYKANIGKLLNKGFEASANVFLIRNRALNLSWSVGGSIIHNYNEIKEISNSLQHLNDQLGKESNINPSFMFKEGQSINTIYAVRSKGIDPSNGREIYIKQDGTETYTWDPKDKVAVGINLPKYQGNFNTSVRFKGITLNAIFSYRFGGQMYNYTLVNKVENIYPYDNADKRVLYDRWKKPGDKAFFKSVTDRTTTNATSRFVMDENTIELRSLSLGYEFPRELIKKAGFEYLSVTGYTEDIFYISTIKQERGLSYPYSKKFSLSVIARF